MIKRITEVTETLISDLAGLEKDITEVCIDGEHGTKENQFALHNPSEGQNARYRKKWEYDLSGLKMMGINWKFA